MRVVRNGERKLEGQPAKFGLRCLLSSASVGLRCANPTYETQTDIVYARPVPIFIANKRRIVFS